MNADAIADPKSSARGGSGGLLSFLVKLAIAAWILRSLIAAPFYIPSGSMLPRLYIGDYLFVAKWPFGYSRFSFPGQIPRFSGRILSHLPVRGDIVVLRPPDDESHDLIKRVVGLPGDQIAVRGGALVLNGQPVPRRRVADVAIPVTPNSPCRHVTAAAAEIHLGGDGGGNCRYPAFVEALPGAAPHLILDQADGSPGDSFGPVTVPADHVFLMGDNRDDSLDSRFDPSIGGLGPVPMDHLVGRALFSFWSTDGSASWLKPWTWFSALRASRIGHGY